MIQSLRKMHVVLVLLRKLPIRKTNSQKCTDPLTRHIKGVASHKIVSDGKAHHIIHHSKRNSLTDFYSTKPSLQHDP
jgi:hypothetical protein